MKFKSGLASCYCGFKLTFEPGELDSMGLLENCPTCGEKFDQFDSQEKEGEIFIQMWTQPVDVYDM